MNEKDFIIIFLNIQIAMKNYIGKTINPAIEKELLKQAQKEGCTKIQVRKPGYMYDCRFDTQRLQVIVDENNQIKNYQRG